MTGPSRYCQDLMENTPTDGMLSGLGTVRAFPECLSAISVSHYKLVLYGAFVSGRAGRLPAQSGGFRPGQVNANKFGKNGARCMVISYDYTVLAGTQGGFNHKKLDRMNEIATRLRIPCIMFAEGGGGRPGDTDVAQSNNLTLRTFETWCASPQRPCSRPWLPYLLYLFEYIFRSPPSDSSLCSFCVSLYMLYLPPSLSCPPLSACSLSLPRCLSLRLLSSTSAYRAG